MNLRIVSSLVVVVLLAVIPLAADDPFPDRSLPDRATPQVEIRDASWRPDWGTQSYAVQTVSAAAFETVTVAQTTTFDYWYYRRATATGAALLSPLVLPAGAKVVAVELQACDWNASGSVRLLFASCPHRGLNDCTWQVPVDTGDPETPGCNGYFAPLDPPVTVDNLTTTYGLEVNLTAAANNLSFLSVLVTYQLQVSPAPGTATFGDVPTGHAFFQYVEALAASGITAGCGGGNYCPDSPLTRGQMAVFLSKALGLHWPF